MSDGIPIELPVVTARRGGIRYGEKLPPMPPRSPLPPAPEGAAPGRWHFAVIDDGEVYATPGFHDREPFLHPDDALAAWGHLDAPVLVRRWVPDRHLPEWEPHVS